VKDKQHQRIDTNEKIDILVIESKKEMEAFHKRTDTMDSDSSAYRAFTSVD